MININYQLSTLTDHMTDFFNCSENYVTNNHCQNQPYFLPAKNFSFCQNHPTTLLCRLVQAIPDLDLSANIIPHSIMFKFSYSGKIRYCQITPHVIKVNNYESLSIAENNFFDGCGQDYHPLTRILIWKSLLKHHSHLSISFEKHHFMSLYEDSVKMGFIRHNNCLDVNNLNDLIQRFETDSIYQFSLDENYIDNYMHHFALLHVLKNLNKSQTIVGESQIIVGNLCIDGGELKFSIMGKSITVWWGTQTKDINSFPENELWMCMSSVSGSAFAIYFEKC